MTWIRVLILSVILISLGSAVRLRNHEQIDQEAYLAALEEQQSKLEAGAEDLDKSVSSVDADLAQLTEIQDKIALL